MLFEQTPVCGTGPQPCLRPRRQPFSQIRPCVIPIAPFRSIATVADSERKLQFTLGSLLMVDWEKIALSQSTCLTWFKTQRRIAIARPPHHQAPSFFWYLTIREIKSAWQAGAKCSREAVHVGKAQKGWAQWTSRHKAPRAKSGRGSDSHVSHATTPSRTWNLTGGPKRNLTFQVPSHRWRASGREGSFVFAFGSSLFSRVQNLSTCPYNSWCLAPLVEHCLADWRLVASEPSLLQLSVS